MVKIIEMKTAEEKSKEYCEKTQCQDCGSKKSCDIKNEIGFCLPSFESYDAFIAGYNEAQRWISVEEDLPSRENYQHEKCLWKNEKNVWYGSAYESQKPTHWRPIND